MQTTLRTTQIESAVRAAVRGGLRVGRVTVDHQNRRIELETTIAEEEGPSFDSIDFRVGK
jgi:hypothetical protein